MDLAKLNVGDRVKDSWWPNNPGRVVKVRKTRIVVRFDYEHEAPADYYGNPLVYDLPHAHAFLQKA